MPSERLNLFHTGFQKQHQIVPELPGGQKNLAYLYLNKFIRKRKPGLEIPSKTPTLLILTDVPGGASNNSSVRGYTRPNQQVFLFPAAAVCGPIALTDFYAVAYVPRTRN
ncbi:hypothetical protein [Candidatus Avelusimicrobium fimicolum]|uniref:hypothetical protein n=1 Tax=Candidatus Avelusimicrobium fimicolum TaxID=3416216 RepID=UPI003D1058BA